MASDEIDSSPSATDSIEEEPLAIALIYDSAETSCFRTKWLSPVGAFSACTAPLKLTVGL